MAKDSEESKAQRTRGMRECEVCHKTFDVETRPCGARLNICSTGCQRKVNRIAYECRKLEEEIKRFHREFAERRRKKRSPE